MGFLLGIAIALVLIVLFLRISVNIICEYKDNKPCVAVKVLGIKYVIVPSRQKKSKYKRLSASSYRKKLEKMKKREELKRIKKEKQAQKKRLANQQKKQQRAKEKELMTKEQKTQKRQDLVNSLRFFAGIGVRLLKRFGKRLKIKSARMHIVVASPDAATTAVMYGAITQAASFLYALLEKVANFSYDKNEFSISADFCSESLRADVCLIFKIRIWHVFALALGFAFNFVMHLIKGKFEKKQNTKSKENENAISNAVNEAKS